jgi:Na+-transporting NADH:ubiquinone oxidoreductase subunit NqrE
VGISPFVIFFASIFTSNVLLTNFLGMCSYLSISKDLKSSFGTGRGSNICHDGNIGFELFGISVHIGAF